MARSSDIVAASAVVSDTTVFSLVGVPGKLGEVVPSVDGEAGILSSGMDLGVGLGREVLCRWAGELGALLPKDR